MPVGAKGFPRGPYATRVPPGRAVLRSAPTALPHTAAPILGQLTNAAPAAGPTAQITAKTILVASGQLDGW